MKKIDAEIMPMYAVSEEDAKTFIGWAWQQRRATDFDMEVVGYPRACMSKATMDGATSVMMPFHPVIMFESFLHDPALNDMQKVLAMRRIEQKVDEIMKLTGHREAYFLTNSEREVHTCSRHGWVVAMAGNGQWLMKKKFEGPKEN